MIATKPHAEEMTETAIVELVTEEKKEKKKAGRPKGVKRAAKKLRQHEIALIANDYVRGMPQHEIAKKFGVSDASVSMILAQFKPIFSELANVEQFRQVKADVLDAASLTLLKEIVNPSKIEQANVRELAYSFDALAKHGRLERGLSTSNVATQTVAITLSASNYSEE